MDREELKKILPHREPMLLVDEAELKTENSAVGSYTVKGSEWFLQGHFPQKPIVPGVIQCEIMGQISSVLLADKIKGNLPLYTGLDRVRFKRQVVPGDTLVVECSIVRTRPPFYFIKAKGTVNGQLAVSGELSFAIISQ